MAPIIQVFGFSVQAGPLAVLIGFVAGLWLSSRLAALRRLDGGAINDAGFYGAIAGLIAARVGYVVVHWPAYAGEPLSALMPGLTALLPWTGWPAGLVVAGWIAWRKNVLRADLFDVLAPGIVLLAMGLATAALLNGESLGQSTALPWAVTLWGENRHPVPVYELVALAVIALICVRLLGRDLPPAAIALGALAAYAFARVVIDGFRTDVPLLAGLRVTQLAGVVVCAVALWMLGELPPSSASGSVDDRTLDD